MGKLAIVNRIGQGVQRAFPGVVMTLKTYGPEICTGISIVSGVGAVIASGIAGSKVEAVLDAGQKRKDEVIEKHKKLGTVGSKEYQRDIRRVTAGVWKEMVKLFGPTAALELLSIASSLGGRHMLRKENAALAASAAAIGRAYDQYRQNVIADQGKEKDAEYAGPQTKDILEMSEDGQAPRVVRRGAGPGANPFGILIDKNNVHWQRDPHSMITFLKWQEKLMQDRIMASTRVNPINGKVIPGYLFWNDMLPYVMSESEAAETMTPEGQFYGFYYGGVPLELNIVETIVDDEPAWWLDIHPEAEPITWVFRKNRAEQNEQRKAARKQNRKAQRA